MRKTYLFASYLFPQKPQLIQGEQWHWLIEQVFSYKLIFHIVTTTSYTFLKMMNTQLTTCCDHIHCLFYINIQQSSMNVSGFFFCKKEFIDTSLLCTYFLYQMPFYQTPAQLLSVTSQKSYKLLMRMFNHYWYTTTNHLWCIRSS